MSKTRILDAVRRLDIAETRALLDAKPALADVRDASDRNLLHIACSVQDPAATRMAAFLLDRGFDVEALSGRDRCTPLFFAVARARSPKLAKLLIDAARNRPTHPAERSSPPRGGTTSRASTSSWKQALTSTWSSA
jgi:ankyrin repeat protein